MAKLSFLNVNDVSGFKPDGKVQIEKIRIDTPKGFDNAMALVWFNYDQRDDEKYRPDMYSIGKKCEYDGTKILALDSGKLTIHEKSALMRNIIQPMIDTADDTDWISNDLTCFDGVWVNVQQQQKKTAEGKDKFYEKEIEGETKKFEDTFTCIDSFIELGETSGKSKSKSKASAKTKFKAKTTDGDADKFGEDLLALYDADDVKFMSIPEIGKAFKGEYDPTFIRTTVKDAEWLETYGLEKEGLKIKLAE